MSYPIMLSAIVHGQDLQACNKVTWTETAIAAFERLKQTLQTTPALGIPDPMRPFTQIVDEKGGCMTSALLQEHGAQAAELTALTEACKLAEGKQHIIGFTNYSQRFCERCVICATNNIGRGIPITQSAHPPPQRPFEHLQIDFVELTPSKGKKYCLVIVDMLSKWVEAFPTSKQDASAVAKALLTEIIPRWGIPERIGSDHGTPFVNKALQRVSHALDPLQFAYREKVSVDDGILYLLHQTLFHFDKGAVRIMFFYFSSDFNTIQPLLLRNKLTDMQVDSHLVTWITDYLTRRPQYVRTRDCIYEIISSSTGAPQGTVLAPFLFTLYTSDFIYSLELCHMQRFSDDTAIVGFIRDGQEGEYRGLVKDFLAWCKTSYNRTS
ncbi:hypothetical protein QTP86_003362 [Hemibagrus guttatus]|nr:hypothetical protein QTP86_003362 [Hemibagrus guttatus]